MHYTPSVLQLPFGSYSVFAMPGSYSVFAMLGAWGLVLGIAATAHATLPSAGPLVVSVLLNGGFEEPPLLPQQTSDEDEQIASWELSEGATLQWQEGDVPAYEGDACVRLYPGSWVEQTTSIGGEGSFVLSLWARQCGQAACSKDPCERPPLQRLTHLSCMAALRAREERPRRLEVVRRLRLRPSACPKSPVPTAFDHPGQEGHSAELLIALDGAELGCVLPAVGNAWSRVSCALDPPVRADLASADGVLRLALPAAPLMGSAAR